MHCCTSFERGRQGECNEIRKREKAREREKERRVEQETEAQFERRAEENGETITKKSSLGRDSKTE